MGLPKNFHGGRIYADEPDEEAGFAAWLRSTLKSLFRHDNQRNAASPSPPRRHESPYSVLGAEDHDVSPANSGRPVFPIANWVSRPGASVRRRRTDVPAGATGAEHPHH